MLRPKSREDRPERRRLPSYGAFAGVDVMLKQLKLKAEDDKINASM